MVFVCDKAQVHPQALAGQRGYGVCKWSHRKHKTSFKVHREAVLWTPGCEEGFWCPLMGRPKLQETCILAVITSVKAQQ